jgi:putative lipoprotein (rSAM/lipoprotein system)
MPRCGDDEVLFRGKVVSSASKRAIEGIRVSIADTSEYHHKYRYRHDITDNNGNYNFYACGRDLRYQRHDIFFEDVDSTQNGLYESKSMVIQYGSQNEIEINVTLDEVK